MRAASYITPDRFSAVANLPISLPQVELRRGSSIQLAEFRLTVGQFAIVRLLNLNVIKVLNPGTVPDIVNSSFGVASAGVYGPINSWGGHMLCSPIIRVTSAGIGVASLNPYSEHIIGSPGLYVVQVFNNTGRTFDFALDMAVSVTGVIKFYS
ncbi:MAG: hypothetical protein ACYSUV_02000 [Planctomycetota bacterium]|jgi:hypothetical protein